MRVDLQSNLLSNSQTDLRQRQNQAKGKKSHSCLKIFGCLLVFIAMLGIIAAIGWSIINFATGPLIQTVDNLPADFPKELAVREINQTKIQLETPSAKEKVLKFLNSLPNWLLTPLLNYLSESVRVQLANSFGEQLGSSTSLTVADLKNILKSASSTQAQTVSVSWQDLQQAKDALAAQYERLLQAENFQTKKNISDYDINLGFWKQGIFGNMDFKDLNGKTAGTNAEMKVNYLEATGTQ